MYVRVSHFLVCEIKRGVKFQLISELVIVSSFFFSDQLLSRCVNACVCNTCTVYLFVCVFVCVRVCSCVFVCVFEISFLISSFFGMILD